MLNYDGFVERKMVRKCNIDLEVIATGIIIVAMFLLPLTEFFMSLRGEHFLFQEEIVEGFGIVSFVYVVFMMYKNKKVEIYLSDILLCMLFGFAVLSLLFSKDMQQSLYGDSYNYREGILVYFSYYSVALLASRIQNANYRRKLIYAFFIIGIVEILVGILQFAGCWPYPPLFDGEVAVGESSFGVREWAFGFTEQYNFFAALAVVFSALTAGETLLSTGRKRWRRWLALSGVCFFGIMTTYTRIGWLGTIGYICFAILLYFISRKKNQLKSELSIKKITALMLLYIAIFFAFMIIFPRARGNITESIEEAESGDFGRLGNGRMFFWIQGLETVPEYWYVGTGLDNYVYAFFWDDPDYIGYFQDKAHNEYIHILVTQGVFSLITFLTLIIYNLYTASKRYLLSTVKKDEQKNTFVMLLMYSGYLCQAMVNSSVTNVAIYNWIITGLLLYVADKKILWSFKGNRKNVH